MDQDGEVGVFRSGDCYKIGFEFVSCSEGNEFGFLFVINKARLREINFHLLHLFPFLLCELWSEIYGIQNFLDLLRFAIEPKFGPCFCDKGQLLCILPGWASFAAEDHADVSG
jgi:hypothetical protein